MKKQYTKLLPILLALCLIVAGCLAACGPTADDEVTYTVTVQTGTNAPAEGVSVTVKKGGARLGTQKTDASGKATFELAADDYTVELKDLPNGYSLPDTANLAMSTSKTSLTVTLEQNFAYVVKLVDTAGNPFHAEGVTVMMCTFTGNCLAPVALEANGIARIEWEKGNYHVKINGLPAEYTYDQNEDGYYTGENFSTEKTEMTITISPVTPVDEAALMTGPEKTAFTASNGAYTTAMHAYPARHFSTNLPQGGVAYFSIKAPFDGNYKLYTVSNPDVSYKNDGTAFSADKAQGTDVMADYGYSFYIEKGATSYFKVAADAATTAEFIVLFPVASYTQRAGVVETIDVTFTQADAQAVIAFTPTTPGVFTATAQGDTRSYVAAVSQAPDTDIVDNIADSAYTVGSSAQAALAPKNVGKNVTLYYTVSAKGITSFPATLSVKIVRTANVAEDIVIEAKASKDLSQYGTQEGVLTPIPLKSTTTLVKGSDNYYHYGTADGPTVVVLLTKSIGADRWLDGGPALAYTEMLNSNLATYLIDITPGPDKADLTKGDTYRDYRMFLRGFIEYDYQAGLHGDVPVIPENITAETYYAKYVNKDGVYPLTEELKEFLELFYTANKDSIDFNLEGEVDEGYEWLFACYYYKTDADTDTVA